MTTSSDTRGNRSAAPLACVILACAALAGCSSSEQIGRVALRSHGPESLVFERDFVVGTYTQRDSEDSFWFSDIPLSALTATASGERPPDGTFVHAQLLWLPKPGLTPLDPTATNLVTRVLIVADGEAGLYGGAGFARVEGTPGEGRVAFEIDGGTLALLERTKGFKDRLGPTGLSGTLTAELAPEEAARWRRTLSQLASNLFGKSMWVDGRLHTTERAAGTDPLLSRAD